MNGESYRLKTSRRRQRQHATPDPDPIGANFGC
jgi:hypothetical protein